MVNLRPAMILELQKDIFAFPLQTPASRASAQVSLHLTALGRIGTAQNVQLKLFFYVRTIHNHPIDDLRFQRSLRGRGPKRDSFLEKKRNS